MPGRERLSRNYQVKDIALLEHDMSLKARGPGVSAPGGTKINLMCLILGQDIAVLWCLVVLSPNSHARWEQHCQAAKLLWLQMPELLLAWHGLRALFYPMSLLKMHFFFFVFFCLFFSSCPFLFPK